MHHQNHDQRSLDWHHHVVQRMRQEPMLLAQAHAIATRWTARGARRDQPYLDTWLNALEEGIDAVECLATSTTEAGYALRQSSPLSCVLGPDERNAFWSTWHASA